MTEKVEAICREIVALVQQFCGGQLRYANLTEEGPVISLDA